LRRAGRSCHQAAEINSGWGDCHGRNSIALQIDDLRAGGTVRDGQSPRAIPERCWSEHHVNSATAAGQQDATPVKQGEWLFLGQGSAKNGAWPAGRMAG
jgi:hypothetical protein